MNNEQYDYLIKNKFNWFYIDNKTDDITITGKQFKSIFNHLNKNFEDSVIDTKLNHFKNRKKL